MKKLIILVLLLSLATGCNTSKIKKENDKTTTTTKVINEEQVDTYKDNNPIKTGIYTWNENNTNRYLVTIYSAIWKYHTDINTFNVFYTQDELLDSSRIPICFDKYMSNYENIDAYRIGYQIEFEVGDVKYNKTILRPNDPNEFYDYLEIYLYDGYHRKAGEWYSHTTEEEMNENTLLTGIKLTAGKKVNEITSNIKLTAFTYDSDDFDENGYYRGNSKYSIIVTK